LVNAYQRGWLADRENLPENTNNFLVAGFEANGIPRVQAIQLTVKAGKEPTFAVEIIEKDFKVGEVFNWSGGSVDIHSADVRSSTKDQVEAELREAEKRGQEAHDFSFDRPFLIYEVSNGSRSGLLSGPTSDCSLPGWKGK
jgi:hypothetical protein